jgi:hypothetical protein
VGGRLWKCVGGDLEGILIWEIFLNFDLGGILICHAMVCNLRKN